MKYYAQTFLSDVRRQIRSSQWCIRPRVVIVIIGDGEHVSTPTVPPNDNQYSE